MSNEAHYDDLETRDPKQRERAQFDLLPDFLRDAVAHAPGWAAQLKGADLDAVTSPKALARLPVLRKSALKELQAKDPPFGGFATSPVAALGRVFVSPGPIFEPEGKGEDSWRTARVLYAAGIRKGDIVLNTFAYHLTPGGWILDAGARALGCAVIAAGPGNTEQQLDVIERLRPNVYVGVPDYLKILLDKAKEAGRDASCFRRAGAKLGNPTNLEEAGLLGSSVQRRSADQFATSLFPLIEAIRKAGAFTLREIADALNGRGIRPARGVRWHRSSVRNLIARIEVVVP